MRACSPWVSGGVGGGGICELDRRLDARESGDEHEELFGDVVLDGIDEETVVEDLSLPFR